MTIQEVLKLVRDVITALESAGFLKADVNFSDVFADAKAVSAVEAVLKAHGVAVPAKVDQIIADLPVLVRLFGLLK